MLKKIFIFSFFCFYFFISSTYARNNENLNDYQNREILVAVDSHSEPLAFLGHDGRYKGILIDYLNEIEKALGLKFRFCDPNLEKSLFNNPDPDILSFVSKSSIDSNQWLLTENVISFPYLIYAYNDTKPVLDLELIKNKKLAVIRNHDIAGILNRKHSANYFYLAKDSEDALEALKTGNADYFIGDILTIHGFIDEDKFNGVSIVGKTDYLFSGAIAVKQDQELLYDLIVNEMKSLDEGFLSDLVSAWTENKVEKIVDYSLLIKIIIIVLLIIGLFWYYNINLNKLVNQRTKDLIQANIMLEKSKEHYREMYEKADKAVKEKEIAEAEKLFIEEQLFHAQKMDAIGKLAGGIAHDFNNILAVFFAQIHLMRMDIMKGRQIKERIDEFETAASRATKLVEQLLLFSRKSVLDPSYINLNDLLENLLKMISRILGENIEFSFKPGKLTGATLADLSQIEQVVTNLCINARDAMPNGGRLLITTSTVDLRHVPEDRQAIIKPGLYNLLSVSDTGTGIDEKSMKRIFEPFFTTKDAGKGTGLGLAIIYSIVQGHGGFIDVSSKLGEGTKFELYLPSVERQKTAEIDKQALSIKRGNGQTILLAEDDDNLRELVYEFLVDNGYKVILAVDGLKAIELYEHYKESIDLLLLDVVMPNLSGSEVYQYIHKLNPDVPTIFCSGYAFDKLNEFDLKQQEIILVQKPYKIPNLLNLISNTLGL